LSPFHVSRLSSHSLYLSSVPTLAFLAFFFLNNPPPTEIYTLSLHDALPICAIAGWSADASESRPPCLGNRLAAGHRLSGAHRAKIGRHTSELQSLTNLVCRLLLEKKKNRRHT